MSATPNPHNEQWLSVADGFGEVVYFIVSETGLVKIGYSKNLAARLKFLQAQSCEPLTIIRAIPGTRATERAVHSRFSGVRLFNEVFLYDPEMATFSPSRPTTCMDEGADILSFLELWPSRSAFAAATGFPLERVHKWAQNAQIPSKYLGHCLQTAIDCGHDVTAEDLVRMSAKTKAAS